MKSVTFDTTNAICGALLVTTGAFFAYQSFMLELGTALRMGPGYFPLVLSGVLVVLGAIVFVQSLRVEGEPIDPFAWRGMLFILPAPVLFGLTVRGLGFAPSLFLTAFVACFASQKMNVFYALILSLGLTVFSVAVFSYGLGLPFERFGPWTRFWRRDMELFSNLALGFATAATPANLLFCLIGVLLGTLIGVLPGIGATATIAMLLPITFQLEPVSSLIMLAGIYYGAQYGGSTTAILINMPGESSSAVTAIDGYQMARKGRAGAALAIAALGSFFAGTVSTFLVAIFAPPLTEIALKFGAPEYFSLMIVGLVSSIALAHGSVIKALAMVALGLLLGLVGTDIYTGTPRFTLGIREYADGLNFVALAVGVFGIAEILRNLEGETTRTVLMNKVTGLLPSKAEFKEMIAPVLRGTAIGSALGILPGGGAILASFASYTVEKRTSKKPEEFGKGAVAGVAGPESANNAGAQTSFIPLLTLGIPANPVMALMVGAMIIQGIVPGPNVATEQPALFWGIIASMWIGNLMLVILNLPLIGLWVKLLTVPYYVLFPVIMAFCSIGVYSVNSNVYDLYAVAFFGLIGYVLAKLRCEPAPLLLGFVLGPLLEENLRRAMILSRGDPTTFVTRPISATLLAIALGVLIIVFLPSVKKKREEVFVEET